MIDVYISEFGMHKVSPDSPMISGKKTKKGYWDLRTNSGKAAYECEQEFRAKLNEMHRHGLPTKDMIA